MEYLCQHCNNDINANFCSNCGQKRYKRIDKRYVLDEIQYVLIHTNKGFLYSVKNIIKNPGKTAHNFIIGDRVSHYKPLLLAFLLSSISGFLGYKVLKMEHVMSEYFATQHMNSLFMNDMMSFLSSYTSFLYLLLIPLFALCTKIAFSNWGHNYYEHVIMNSYIISCYTIFSVIVVYPILYFFKTDAETFLKITFIAILAVPVIIIWFFKHFYPDKPLTTIIGRSLLSILLAVIAYFIIIISVVMGGFIYAAIKGPEALKYMMPPKA